MANKLDKRTNCEYCDKVLDAKYRSKRFCDDKCRIYWNRENTKKKPTVIHEPQNEPKEEPAQKEKFSSFNDYRKKKLGIK